MTQETGIVEDESTENTMFLGTTKDGSCSGNYFHRHEKRLIRKATTVGKSFNKLVGFEKIRADVPDGCTHTPTMDPARRRTVDRAMQRRLRIDALAKRKQIVMWWQFAVIIFFVITAAITHVALNNQMMEKLRALEQEQGHDVNYKWYYRAVYWTNGVSVAFILVQILGMAFTYLAMFKCMLAYTISMWLGTVIIFLCFGLTLANRGQIESSLTNEAHRYWFLAKTIMPEKISEIQRYHECCGWYNVFDYCDNQHMFHIMVDSMAEYDMYVYHGEIEHDEPNPTVTARTTRSDNMSIDGDRSAEPDEPPGPASIHDSESYDGDLTPMDSSFYIDYNPDSNYDSNYYDESFSSSDYARFKGIAPDYESGSGDGARDRSGQNSIGDVIHKLTRDADSEYCTKGKCLCKKMDENQLTMAYETEVCYTQNGKDVSVNQVCPRSSCHLNGCEKELVPYFKKVILPVVLVTLFLIGGVSLMSLVFITQIAYNFRRHKSDCKQFKINLEKFYVTARQFLYEKLTCNECMRRTEHVDKFKRTQSRDALDQMGNDTFGRDSPFTHHRESPRPPPPTACDIPMVNINQSTDSADSLAKALSSTLPQTMQLKFN